MKQLALVMVALLLIVGVVTAGDLLPEETMTIIEKPTIGIKETPTITEEISIAEPVEPIEIIRPISEKNPFAIYRTIGMVDSEPVDAALILVSGDGLKFNFTESSKLSQMDATSPDRVMTVYTAADEPTLDKFGLQGLTTINLRFRLDDGRILIIRRGVV